MTNNQISTAPTSTEIRYFKYYDLHPLGGDSITVVTNFQLCRNPHIREKYDPHNCLTDDQVLNEFFIINFAQEISYDEWRLIRGFSN